MANCIQYAQWSALFFAVKSGDQETVDFLMENNAEAGIKDEASACFATSLIISYVCVCVWFVRKIKIRNYEKSSEMILSTALLVVGPI